MNRNILLSLFWISFIVPFIPAFIIKDYVDDGWTVLLWLPCAFLFVNILATTEHRPTKQQLESKIKELETHLESLNKLTKKEESRDE